MTRTDERKNCINFCFHAYYLFGFLKLKRVNFCSFSGAVEIPNSTKILCLYSTTAATQGHKIKRYFDSYRCILGSETLKRKNVFTFYQCEIETSIVLCVVVVQKPIKDLNMSCHLKTRQIGNSTISRKKICSTMLEKWGFYFRNKKKMKKPPQIQCKFLILKNQFSKLGFGISNPLIMSALIVHQGLSEKLGHFLMFQAIELLRPPNINLLPIIVVLYQYHNLL